MTDTADAPLTYTVKNVTAKTEVSATLIERPTYTITVTSEGSGTALAEPASVKRGGSTTITAVPSSNSYYLKEWSVNGGAAPGYIRQYAGTDGNSQKYHSQGRI